LAQVKSNPLACQKNFAPKLLRKWSPLLVYF
jgi:hypothetical protein